MLKNLHNNRGFTFVELMVSMAILALIATAIVGVMSSNTGIFRRSKADLDVQNIALDSLNQLENDVMQAKYIYIEADGKKYVCASDKNLIAEGGKSKIDDLINLSEADLQTLYKGFQNSDPTGTKRNTFDSYYNKVRYMSQQDKVIYEAFLDSGIDSADATFQSLKKTDILSNVSLIRIVYPVKLDTPYTVTTTSADGTPITEEILYEACVIDYTFASGVMSVKRSFCRDTTSGFYRVEGAAEYTDLIYGDLSASIDSISNTLRYNLSFEKNGRKYNSERTVTIRNSYVLGDQGDVDAEAAPSPTPTP